MPPRPSVERDYLRHLLGTSLARTTELRDIGVPARTIHHRCRPGGPWRRILPGVVLLHSGSPSRDDRRQAALLYAGPESVLTGLDGLALHGMNRMPPPTGAVHVLIPSSRRRVGTSDVLVERTERLPLPASSTRALAPIGRAALDFARRCQNVDQVRSTLAEVVQRGRGSALDLGRELDAGCARGSALPRRVLAEIGDGVRSAAEAKARILLESADLPQAWWNSRVHDRNGRFVAVPDAWFDDVAMAWEIDSVEFHLSPADYAKTLDRRSAMMAAGIVVMHTLPSKLTRRPTEVLTELRSTYHQAALRPRPPLTAVRPDGANGTFAQPI